MHKRLAILLFAAALVVAIAGCGRTNGVKTNEYKARSHDQRMLNEAVPPRGDGQMRSKALTDRTGDGAMNGTVRAENERKAKKLATDLVRVKGVDRADVLVNNRDIVVGLDIKHGQNAATVAQHAKQAAEKSHPGHHVYVTTDKAMHQRVTTLASQMHPLDGHPVRNFSEDVATLIRDVGRTVTAPFR